MKKTVLSQNTKSNSSSFFCFFVKIVFCKDCNSWEHISPFEAADKTDDLTSDLQNCRGKLDQQASTYWNQVAWRGLN